MYIRMKLKAAEEIGMAASCLRLPSSTSQGELLTRLQGLNSDPAVDGIIVQMPLDTKEEIDSHLVTDAVSPDKDVDGLCTINEGRVATGDLTSGFLPCTPHGSVSHLSVSLSPQQIDVSAPILLASKQN